MGKAPLRKVIGLALSWMVEIAPQTMVFWFGNVSASMAREEEFAWSHEPTIGTPKVIHDRWNDAAMHVASYEKVEFVEITGYFRIEQKYGRVKQSDFGFMLWQVAD